MPPKRDLNQLGQVSILIAMMMLTFMLFFIFVINTGLLIHAKINLQNAADLAAYAGASVQARQLNQVATLNYEMRRQYKKFLFRYYVIGNMAQRSHPGAMGPLTGPRTWSPDWPPAQGGNYQVPAVCVIFNQMDNFCAVSKTRGTQISQSSPSDAINSTLQAQLLEIEKLRQKNCVAIGITNLNLLAYWLYNTDPDLTEVERILQRSGTNTDQAAALSVIRGLAQGLGLVPKLLLLHSRVETLQSYLNFSTPPEGVTLSDIEAYKQHPDAAMRERPIQAYLSAYETLSQSIFSDSSQIVLKEYLPPGADGQASVARFEPIQTEFDAYAVNLEIKGDPNQATKGEDCIATPVNLKVPLIPLGVYKDPQIQTFYLVKLEAMAKLMFSPWGPIRLKAYSAAQPFGSRIGPKLSASAFTRQAQYSRCGFSIFKCVGQVPNLALQESDPEGPGNLGWNLQEVIYAYYQKFAPELGPGGGATNIPRVIDVAAMERAYQAAMAPNPWESGKYQIPNDLVPDPLFTQFSEDSGEYSFWAPVISPDQAQNAQAVEQKIQNLVQQSLINPKTGTLVDSAFSGQFQQSLIAGLRRYLGELQNGRGEYGESFHIARIQDPFYTRPQPSANGPARSEITLDSRFMMRDPEKVRTSWNSAKGGEDRGHSTRYGRTGYSVKYVSVQSLLKKENPPDGVDNTRANDVPSDSESELDFNSGFLQH